MAALTEHTKPGDHGAMAVVDEVRFDIYTEKRFTDDEKAQIRKVLSSDKWPKELCEFAVKALLPTKVTDKTLKDFEERLEFIKVRVPLEFLIGDSKFGFAKLLGKRVSFLSALADSLGKTEWENLLRDDEKCKQYARAAFLGDPIYRLSDEMFEGFAKRDAVPVEAEVGAEDRLEELQDVLGQTGIEKIALPLANKIIFAKPNDPNTVRGHNHNFTGDVIVSTGVEKKPMLIPVLLHELGHAMEKRVSRDDRAREIFDRYIVLSQLEATKHSPYVDSFELTDGKASGYYVEESFAEDFRLYWLKPEALSSGKSAIFDEFCDRFLGGVDREKARAQIRSVLGNFYGRSVNDIFQMIDCYVPRKLAERRKK